MSVNPNKTPPRGYSLRNSLGYVSWVSSTRSLAGRTECTTLPTVYERIMVKCLAQWHKCITRIKPTLGCLQSDMPKYIECMNIWMNYSWLQFKLSGKQKALTIRRAKAHCLRFIVLYVFFSVVVVIVCCLTGHIILTLC